VPFNQNKNVRKTKFFSGSRPRFVAKKICNMENKLIKQEPIGSGFTAASTTTDVIKGINLTGRTAIVTGGYAGIGLETTKTLAEAGATVIVPARDLKKAKLNLEGVRNVEITKMDLTDRDSINSFATSFLDSYDSLHLLINNAGIMWVPLQRDSRGYESQLSANHIGHFHLTALLWPALKKAEGARVINVSSWGHHFSPFVFEDYNFINREYETLLGYGQSKTANILFTVELDRLGKKDKVRAFSLHPGAIVDTDLKRHLSEADLIKIGVYDSNGDTIRDAAKGLKTIPQGAATTIWAATSGQLEGMGGLYCENNDVARLDTNSIPTSNLNSINLPGGVMPYAVDPENAKKLWILSEELCGVSFNIA
jgi:NAD(P)-dependent dehydrogenase (short-subunit alcohol dehydrogenase family)